METQVGPIGLLSALFQVTVPVRLIGMVKDSLRGISATAAGEYPRADEKQPKTHG